MIIVNNIYKMLADESEPIFLNEEQEIENRLKTPLLE